MNRSSPNPWNSLPGPDDTRRVILSNGITLLIRSNQFSPSVVLSGSVSCGSLLDPVGKRGLAYFTALGLMRGNATRTFQQIYDCLESVGASLSFSGGMHTASFSGRALVEDLPLLFSLLSDSLRTPNFPEAEIENLRGQLLTGLAIRAQDTEQMASLTFDELLYLDHPYAQPEDGYPETIRAISLADLRKFHSEAYGPQRMILAIVGAVEPEMVIALAEQMLGDWVNIHQVKLPEMPVIPELNEKRQKHVDISGKSQTDVDIGCFGPRRTDPEYLAVSLGNSILGQFGMMGRIGDAVREKAGLAYQASTALNAGLYSGEWEVIAGVNPVNLEKAINIILKELKRFINEPVTLEELQDSQANFIGRLPLWFESNMGVANSLINIERFQLGLDYYRRLPGLVQAVTSEEVLAASRKYLDPDRLVVASAGGRASAKK